MRQWGFSLVVLAATVLPSSASYAQIDPLIEGAKMCTRHLTRYEREYGIPTHLLSAISSIESGRYHKGLKIRLPWPWAVNVEGKGYMFDSKEEAVAAVRKFRSQGARSIDVGCMQVNLVHHASAFASLDKAFDPETNIAYAASFLRSLYEGEGSWKTAAADYHSKTPGRGNKYAGMVYNSWYQIIDKLRSARMQTADAPVAVADTSTVAPLQIADTTPTTLATASARPVYKARPAYKERPLAAIVEKAPEKQMASNTTTRHIRSISVSNGAAKRAPTRSSPDDVLVINANAPMANVPVPVPAPPKTIMIAQAHTDEAKIIHLDSPAPVVPIATARQSGPNFIFRD